MEGERRIAERLKSMQPGFQQKVTPIEVAGGWPRRKVLPFLNLLRVRQAITSHALRFTLSPVVATLTGRPGRRPQYPPR